MPLNGAVLPLIALSSLLGPALLLTAGEDPMWVARQMGHSDWGMIRKVYARWLPDINPNAGTKINALVPAFSQPKAATN